MAAWPTLTGRQEPENLVMAPGDLRQGNEVITLAKRAGSNQMPWQCGVIRAISAKTPAGTWVHTTCVLLVPRQNGKSEILVALILYRIFVLDETVVYTAHEWKSAQPVAERLIEMIESRPWLDARVEKKLNSQGEARVVLSGPRDPSRPNLDSKGNPKVGKVIFRTRSAKAGRGLDEVDTLVYDEGFDVSDASVASLNPTQDAAKDPQVIYASSPVNRDEHPNGVQLSALRHTALQRQDPSMFLAEFRAPEGADREDPLTWALGNPSFGVIKSERKMRNLMANMQTERGRKNFDVEALGIGDYFVFDEEAMENETVVDLDYVASLHDPEPRSLGKSCVAIDASNDVSNRTWTVAVAIRTERGVHGQIGYSGPATVAQIVEFVSEVVDRNDPLAVIVDPRSAAGVTIHPLIEAGIEPEEMTAMKVAAATQGFLQKVDDGVFTHDGDNRLIAALEVARLREIGDGGIAWAKRKSEGDISPLVAMSNAAWGLNEFDVKQLPPPPAPQLIDDDELTDTMTDALASLRW